MIELKTKKEITLMQESGAKLSQVMQTLKDKTKPGMTTGELNDMAEKLIAEKGGTPSFKGYKGFPAALCTSLNETVVHGIPSHSKRLKEGDLLSLDSGLCYKGFHSDMAITFFVGKECPKAKKLVEVTKKTLEQAISFCKAGITTGDLGHQIETFIKKNGFTVVEGLCGHGIGREVHEDPQILNTGVPGKGETIEEGLVFCIEPMVTTGSPKIEFAGEEGIKTKNLSAHFEHMIAIVDGKAKILTN